MNDAKTAVEVEAESLREEAQDLLEMGSVSKETKGSIGGDWYDGGLGRIFL